MPPFPFFFSFAVGGLNSESLVSSDCNVFDPITLEWAHVSRLLTGRSGCGIAAVGTQLFVFGGYNAENAVLDSIECLDTAAASPEWELLPAPMPGGRYFPGIATIGDHVYVIGGYDRDFNPVASAERFDVRTRQWTQLPKMHAARGVLGVGVLGDDIYAIGGGGDGGVRLTSVEILSTASNTWRTAKDLRAPRSHMRIVSA